MTANIADAGDKYKDQIIVAAKYGYALVNRHTGEMSYLRKVWDDQEGPQKAERFVRVRRCLGIPLTVTGCVLMTAPWTARVGSGLER